MAQTKRKRRTKHRGNAAGVVEARGRTGRPPSPDERKKQERAKARDARRRQLKAPSWTGSMKKAGLAAGFMFVFLLVTNKFRVVPAIIFAVVAMGLYIPTGYYMDGWIYRRQLRKQGLLK